MPQYRRVAVAIVNTTTQEVLLMKRCRNGFEYYCFPGGKQEHDETVEETAIREIQEETTLNVQLQSVIGVFPEPDCTQESLYFLTTEYSGSAELAGSEKEYSCESNTFALTWIPVQKCKNLPLHPQKVVEELIALCSKPLL